MKECVKIKIDAQDIKALQDTIYVIGGSGNYLLSILYVMAISVLATLKKAFRELQNGCYH